MWYGQGGQQEVLQTCHVCHYTVLTFQNKNILDEE